MSLRIQPALCPVGSQAKRAVCIFDRRFQHSKAKEEWLETSDLDLHAFLRTLSKTFSVPAHETFVLVTTERRVLDAAEFLQLQNGATLYMLRRQDQTLERPTEELINFTPHHDTVVESGTFKYYDSEGKKSLPYALADLVDNALTATANNTGERTIEIQMLFDENQGKHAVIVLDNGCGMTSKQLNNWAVYKLSKFTRDSQSNQGGYIRPEHFPRSLNSDISYFGVGGKQAAFYIGKATRMISKSLNSPDVHELVLSKSLFEKKEKNKEDTYSTTILNRRPGDFSHINKSQEQFLQELIEEECNKESFTAVVITEVLPEHIDFLREEIDVWSRQLAHIYHYYIHGVDGNIQGAVPEAKDSDSNQTSKIDIIISFKTKSRTSYKVNLRDIHTDMQTQYIKAAVSTFEFKACTNPDAGIVEGIIRYHPFLYENETYPEDPDVEPDHVEDEDEDLCVNDISAKKRKRPIFECFWNGRLIPYTAISEFDWCSQPSKGDKVPPECYSRVSGVLFTDDTFKVTENKLTFIDLEKKLKNKDTVFSYVIKGQKQRTNLQREFNAWLLNCHEKFDKQVKFMNYQDTITRTDVPTKRKQHPWATFSSVEWHGRVYEAGQYVKTQKTLPIYHGTVKRFMFYGNHECDGDVFAPGGQVEICLEPKGLYDCTKILQLSKIDRSATTSEIKKAIKLDSAKLPDKLKVEWPNNNAWQENSTQLTGAVLGPIQVQIVNKNDELISRISSGGRDGKKLSVELKLVHHVSGQDIEISSCVAQRLPKWGFWFKAIEHFMELGKYTVHLNTVMADTNEPEFGGRRLPHYKLRFTIKEGKAEQFDIGEISNSIFVGVPFDIPLELKDIYGHPVEATSDLIPTLQSSDLDIAYEEVKCEGKILLIRKVRATGKLKKSLHPNPYDLQVTLEGLKEHSKTLRISLLPGRPHFIHVIPKDDPIFVENGNPVEFQVIIQDEVGNATAHPRMIAQCLVPDQSPASINCSTGIGKHVTKPIKLSINNGKPQRVNVQFSVPNCCSIKEVIRALLVLPSKRAHRMELYKQDGMCLMVKNNEKIEWLAGALLGNLYFKLYDEANEEVALTDEVASKIKVNWTGNLNQKDLIRGKLPDINVPTKVCEERFYQVSYQDQCVSFSFTIIPLPDEAARLKATVPKCTARLGESLPEPIILELVDQYSNVTKTLTPTCVAQITAEGESLDKTHLTFKLQDSCSVVVTGVCFTDGTPGNREMSFTFRSFTCCVKLKVVAGIPAKLNLVRGPTQPLHIFNENGIPTPFLIQLCDKWDNPSPDQRVVVKMWPSPSQLKVNANVSSQPVDAKGQASFTVMCVSGPKGYYQLKFEGIFNKEPIGGPCVNLTVLPDPNKPVCLNVQYDTAVTFAAGELFPVFSVTVMSDEGRPITSFSPAAVSMLCWKGVLAGKTPPNTALEFQCSKPTENENKSAFYFREKPIPEDAGKYTVQFCLCERQKKIALYSEQIIANVVPNKPVKLAPDHPPPAQVVSYSQELVKRTLLENMTLKIVDQFGNPAGQRLNGEVEICIKNLNSESTIHPLFEDKTDCFKIKLMDGKAHVERLSIMKNSPGEHGVTYAVLFRPLLSPEPPEPLDSFEFPFSFSNDAQSQEKRVALTRERDSFNTQIRKSMDKINLWQNLIKEYSDLQKSSCAHESLVRNELYKRNLHIPENATGAMINGIIKDKMQEAHQIVTKPRRICRLRNDYGGILDVLGKVGHLAFVEDDAEAWVISWHIRGDMNCVITKTTEAARRIYDMTHGNQEVMSIDGINEYCKRPLQPLPHISKHFAPVGNPVYAVDVLKFPQHQAQCEILFKNLLANTILIEDLDSANTYRQLAVKNKVACPTILTRDGQRITGKGKFGGTQNKAPPRNQLDMFGSPLPDSYFILQKDIDLLKEYQKALEKKLQSEAEFTEICKKHLPSIKKNESQLADMRRKLGETQRELDTPAHPVKRVCPSSERTLGIPTKRAKSGSTDQYR